MADSPSDYSLKRLRDLCAHIHEENTAFLLFPRDRGKMAITP
jgi:hypothetical protein